MLCRFASLNTVNNYVRIGIPYLLTKNACSLNLTQLVIAQEFLFQLKENGEKDDLDTADPDCATVSKKFSFFEHYEEEKSKSVEHKVSCTNCPQLTFFGVK